MFEDFSAFSSNSNGENSDTPREESDSIAIIIFIGVGLMAMGGAYYSFIILYSNSVMLIDCCMFSS